MVELRRLATTEPDFEDRFAALLDRGEAAAADADAAVAGIIADVRARGDTALLEYTRRFDGSDATSVAELEIPQARLEAARQRLSVVERTALETAAERLRRYGEHQRIEAWSYTEADGTVLGQRVTPLDRVGLYVPGGKAAYPSSVLMNAIPAQVAGVAELYMAVPCTGGEVMPLVLAAAAIAGVDRVFMMGGAQAVAALAYGTETIPAVDKVVGPGNIYVAAAKRRVYGTVGIDMIAGPSEVAIVCDGTTAPDWVALDLFAQAEHDEDAQAVLLSPDAAFLDAVTTSIRRLLPGMERRDIITESLRHRGALVQVRDLDEAAALVNRMAPEHLELSVADPEPLCDRIRHAGAIFLGRHTTEVLGDYCAGPNHVLPTARSARFFSPLGVYDFQKRSSILKCTPAAARTLGATAAVLARGEGLDAHARSAESRMEGTGEEKVQG